MQKIYYEKEIDLSKRLKELISLTVDESIDYQMEDGGIRAVGSLIIKGEYLSDEEKLFVENIDVDIYASEDKILDKRDFHLKIEDFNYEILDGNLKIKIEVGIYGVIEGDDHYINAKNDPISEIEQLSRVLEKQVENDETKAVSKPQEIVDEIPLSEKVYETKTKVDTADNDDDIGVYYLYVINGDDTYDSISEKYQVAEKTIRDYNANVDLVAGSILIIPYVNHQDNS